jgi:hypothetical protein
MGISRIAFLFDVNKFKKTFQPFIGELENNNYANLRTVSTQKVKNDPSLWEVLDYFGYFKSDVDREEEEFDTIESRVMFWINILVAESCNDAIKNPVNARVIGEILPLLKIESDVVLKLQTGKPFGALLMPERRQELPFWCKRFSVGWLSKEDCQEILALLEKAYFALKPQDLSLRGNLDDVLSILSNLIDMLSSALREEKGLLLGYSA